MKGAGQVFFLFYILHHETTRVLTYFKAPLHRINNRILNGASSGTGGPDETYRGGEGTELYVSLMCATIVYISETMMQGQK